MVGVSADRLKLTDLIGFIKPAQRKSDQRPVRSLDNLIEI
jgi:hypothetical protein